MKFTKSNRAKVTAKQEQIAQADRDRYEEVKKEIARRRAALGKTTAIFTATPNRAGNDPFLESFMKGGVK